MNSDFDLLSSEVPETSPPESESESELDSEPELQWLKLSHKQCCQIQILWFIARWIYTKIVKVIEQSLSTIFHVCMQSITSPWRKSKRIKLTTSLHKHLISEATKNAVNRHKSLHQIALSVGLSLSENALHWAFVKEGYHHRHARVKPFLTELHKIWRLEFARPRAAWDKYLWRTVYWTDECYIWLREAWGVLHITLY